MIFPPAEKSNYFFDLYYVMPSASISAEGLVDGLIGKYGENRNYYYIFQAFNYFDDAERGGVLPFTSPSGWNTIKDFFSGLQPQLMQIYADRREAR